MAKQTSLIKINGKADGQSFYTSKNGGALMRSINKGIGQRVKDAKEYANTRKNNAEFGMCGDAAGALIKPFTVRWRFILDSIATGKMVKALKELVVLNSTAAWGQRTILSTFFQNIRNAWNSLSKNEMLSEIVSQISRGVTYDADTQKVILPGMPSMSADTVQELLDKGANYFYTKVFAVQVSLPTYNSGINAYTKASTALVELPGLGANDNIAIGSSVDLFGATETVSAIAPLDEDPDFGALVVVFLPARKVGQSVSILQQYCSAYMVPVATAE